eukprot:1144253-Pelagomonas_calceolata.AAC.4
MKYNSEAVTNHRVHGGYKAYSDRRSQWQRDVKVTVACRGYKAYSDKGSRSGRGMQRSQWLAEGTKLTVTEGPTVAEGCKGHSGLQRVQSLQ